MRSPGVTPLQPVRLPEADAAGLRLLVKRDDLIHPHVSGNKWRKLIPQTRWLLRGGARGFASVGGVHSNHLAALAALGRELGVPTLGLVRAWDGGSATPTLIYANAEGMRLRPITRTQLRDWRAGGAPAPELLDGLAWLPEGGTSHLGLMGLRDTVGEVERALGTPPDGYWVAVGSGGTAAGLARATQADVHGVLCVGDGGVAGRIEALLRPGHRSPVLHDGALGGFASGEPAIWDAMCSFEAANGVTLDPIYTTKVLLTLRRWIAEQAPGRLAGQTHVMVHTGGLQGVVAWRRRYGYTVRSSSSVRPV